MFGLPVIGPLLALVPSFVWKYLGIAALIAGAYFYVDIKATHRERAIQVAKCEAAAQAAQKAADAQDDKAADQAQQDDEKTTGELIEAKKVSDEEIEKLKAELAKRPASNRCILTKPDAEWLR